MPLERFQKQEDEKCSTILEPGGGDALFGDSVTSKKSSKNQASWTKNLGTGKELDLGLAGTVLKPFSVCAQAQNTVNYSAFTSFNLEKTCRSVAKIT